MMNFINFLTFSRIIIAIFVFILLMNPDGYKLALFLFFLASISDFFDGYLARRFDKTSFLGEVLDPIADKILIVFIFISLSVNLNSYLIGFAASIIISRELWIAALRNINAQLNNSDATKVTFLAKIKTSIQLSMHWNVSSGFFLNFMFLILIADIVLILAVLVTLYTGYEYTITSFKK